MELRIVFVSLCIAAASANDYGVKSGAAAQSGAFAGALAVPGLPDLTKGLPGAGSASYSSSASYAHSSASSYASSNSGTYSFGGSGGPGKVDGGSPLGSGAVANAAAFAGAGAVAGSQVSPGYGSGGAACSGNCPSNPPSGPSCKGDSCGSNPEQSKCSSGSCDNGSSPSTAQGYSPPSKTNKPKDDGLLGYVALDEDDRPGKIETSNSGSHSGQYGFTAGTKSPQFGKPCSSPSCGPPQSNEPSACSGPSCGSGHSCSTPGGCSQQSSGSKAPANVAAFAGSSAGGYGGAPGNTRTPIVNSKPGYSSDVQYSGSFGGAPGILKPDDYSVPDKHISSNSPQYSPSNRPENYIPSSGSHLNAPSPQPIPQTPPVAPGPLYSGPSSYGPHDQKPQHNTPAGLPAFPSSASSSYNPQGQHPQHDIPAGLPPFPSSIPSSYNPHGQKPPHGTPVGGQIFSGSGAFAGATAGSYTGSFGGPPGILKPNDFSFHVKPAKPHGPSYVKPSYQPSAPSGPADVPYQGDFGGAPGVVRPNGPFGTATFPSSQPEKPSFGCNEGSSCESPSSAPHSPSGPECIGPGCSNSGSYHGSFGGPPGILKPTGPSSYTEKPYYPGNPSIGCIGGSSCGGQGNSNEVPAGAPQTQFAPNCGGVPCRNNGPYPDFGGAPGIIKPTGPEQSGSFYSSQHSKPIKGYQEEGPSNHGGYGGVLNSGAPSGASSAGAFAASSASASAGTYNGQGGYGGPGGYQVGQGSGGYSGVYGGKGGYNGQKNGGCEGGCGGGNGGYGGNGAGAASGTGSFGLSLEGAGPGPILGAAKEVAHSFHELGHSIGRNIGGLLLGGAGGGGGLAVSGSFASSGAKSYAY